MLLLNGGKDMSDYNNLRKMRLLHAAKILFDEHDHFYKLTKSNDEEIQFCGSGFIIELQYWHFDEDEEHCVPHYGLLLRFPHPEDDEEWETHSQLSTDTHSSINLLVKLVNDLFDYANSIKIED